MRCEDCHHGCAGCAGCCGSPALTPPERALLDRFSATPFLPVVIDKDRGTVLLPDPELEPNAAGLALRMLQRRGLARIDEIPLRNAGYEGYETWTKGSAALTARGQEALDALEYGG